MKARGCLTKRKGTADALVASAQADRIYAAPGGFGGVSSLESPQQPIGDPLFSILEILIVLLMPSVFPVVAVPLALLFHRATPHVASLEAQ